MTHKLNAPPLIIQKWLNTNDDIDLEYLKGRVVVIYAFQMLCPGCIEHCIPQSKLVHKLFKPEDVQVIGIHTVFEHHDAMTEVSLKAFMHEYRIEFPVGIDEPSDSKTPIPKTMQSYQMQGTPTTVLIDRQGFIRKHKFGHEHDLVIGAEIASLIAESKL